MTAREIALEIWSWVALAVATNLAFVGVGLWRWVLEGEGGVES